MIANVFARSARTMRLSPAFRQPARSLRMHSTESRVELYGRSLTERAFQNPMHSSEAQGQYLGMWAFITLLGAELVVLILLMESKRKPVEEA